MKDGLIRGQSRALVQIIFRVWSQHGPPETVDGPMGSGLCYCTFDNHLCFKVNFNKSANNASLTPPQSGPCCDQAPKSDISFNPLKGYFRIK